MTLSSTQHNCSTALRLPDGSCARCRGLIEPGMPQAFPNVVLSAKTPGIAILLSLLWFGAGHLYANKTASGIVLMVADALMCCLALTAVGLIVAIPVWIITAPIVAALSAQATTNYNRRNGLTLH